MLASPAMLVIEALIPTGISAMPALSTAQPDPIPDVAAIAENAATPEPLDILEQINLYSQADLETGPLEQINSVGELSDVSPTDWAFQAVSALAERHQCLLGYGDGTYRGNRAMTRYEFAASLNACLIQIQERIEDLNALSPEELESIRRLQEEFAAELATLRGRVDALEVRAAELEANQFSPTTKLSGEVLMAPIDAFGDRSETIGGGEDTELSFGYQMRLVFDSSLTGRDRLRARLQSINVARLDNTTGTLMSRLGFDGESENETLLERLEYRFAVTDNLRVWLAGTGITQDHLMNVTNPLFESSGSGALSRFARRNPAVFRQPGGAGVGVEYRFGEWATLYGAYLTENANTPTSKNGLFDGSYSATAQLTATPVENLEVSVTYSNSYFPGGEVNVSGGTGSGNARRPFTNDVATSSNNVGVQASFAFAPVTVSGWAGWSLAEAQVSDGDVSSGDSATLFNWALNVGVPDLVKEGSLLGFIVGQPPKVISNDVSGREDPDTSLHFEALFQYPITDRINIAPGFFVVTNPDHNSDNNTIWVGTVRTQFTF
ncbi:iron uptake porin [Laspinema olomoucense]|uniref:iron uptake porin n=1 Tax=Laspinema olomoucense TaxID=3231600 RepID=UPI0021BA6A95|nr:iron uptake porin [Laspinema sp. D3c]MCT7996283.1 iron uptake porin [Laspinema sp. D3c]